VDATLKQRERSDEQVPRLETIPGMGPVRDCMRCAEFLAQAFQRRNHCIMRFMVGNAYDLTRKFHEPFGVLCLVVFTTSLTHAMFLIRSKLLRRRVKWLIVQTAQTIPGRCTYGKFGLRNDATKRGMTSLIGGRGTWHLSVACFENMLRHSRFEILETRRPSIWWRKRFPWYCALARPL